MTLMTRIHKTVTDATGMGIKCADIAMILNLHFNTVNSILSILKRRGKVINSSVLWYDVKTRSVIKRIKERLQELSASNDSKWAQGYISALADFGCIEESEFGILLEWLLSMQRKYNEATK